MLAAIFPPAHVSDQGDEHVHVGIFGICLEKYGSKTRLTRIGTRPRPFHVLLFLTTTESPHPPLPDERKKQTHAPKVLLLREILFSRGRVDSGICETDGMRVCVFFLFQIMVKDTL